VKRDLVSLTLTEELFKKEWERSVRSITAADFGGAFHRWFQHHEKWAMTCSGYVKKTYKYKLSHL
jgi:hypothetical protein